MNNEEVRHWFAEASERPAAERAAFLECHCQDENVRAEVLSLLAHDTRDAEPVSQRFRDAVAETVESSQPPLSSGVRIGAFQLGRLIGVGGMGRVYEAHRVDGVVNQRVAIKFADLPLSATGREEALERFLRERQILASLRHPYIASLIDAGALDSGLPYAVIEQVEGTPVDVYCDTHHLDTAARIRLAIQLCEAVQFAHRNLIVHRDIKPDNVLVTEEGIPKLIDFGIAKNLSIAGEATAYPAFTPDYASPEQAQGLMPTAATDVYGLGALLYRLLVGSAPRKVTGNSPIDIVHEIAELDVAPASTRKSSIPPDLDNILRKALHRDPDRRYASMDEFADDLRRFLEQRPVRATPDSPAYRASRFVGRHRVSLTVGALVVLGLTTAVAVALRQRADAQQRAMEMRQLVGRLIYDLYDDIANLKGATTAREKLAATASEYLRKLAPGEVADPELAWELINAYYRLGIVQAGANTSTGNSKSAIDFGRQVLKLGPLVEDNISRNSARLDELSVIYAQIAAMFHANSLKTEQRDAVHRLRALSPKVNSYRRAQAFLASARYEDAWGSLQTAVQESEKAVQTFREAVRGNPSPDLTADLAGALLNLGRYQGRLGDFEAGVRSMREALHAWNELAAAYPLRATYTRQKYLTHVWLADLLGGADRYSLGRLDEAISHYRHAVAIAEQMQRADPANQMAAIDVARASGKMGSAITFTHPAESLSAMNRANEAIAKVSMGSIPALEMKLAYLTNSAIPLIELRRLDQAKTHIDQARAVLDQLRKLMPSEPGGLAPILRVESMWHAKAGRRRDALQAAQQELHHRLRQPATTALADSYEAVDTLHRIEAYARGLEPNICRDAITQRKKIWEELQTKYPQSPFIRWSAEATRARANDPRHCQTTPPGSTP